ncbi:hypothetical protein MTR67_037074 [Solanum verrucosum]|uniref:Cytochrome P450 n=1 Tax=Solanum verrucosum TaxID=315347 RepID=A0AAF0UD74_SOLVR|nr:hypothetical protein MTR67_037074 [Solanum verrucosum]
MSLEFFKPLFDSFPWLLQQLNVEQQAVFFSCFLGFLALLWFFISNSNEGLPPGPKSLPLIGNLHSLDPELHTYFASLSQTYGPICRLWFGKKLGIIITSPALAREVLKDQDTIFANRDVPAAAREISYGCNDILWNSYGPKWRMLRKVCVRDMLSCSTLDSVYALRRREFRQSINYFYSQKGLPVNVGEQMFLTVFNVITSMLWGGTVKGGERASLGSEFRYVVSEMAALCSIPNLSDFYPGLAWFDFQGVTKEMKVLLKRFEKIFDSMIDERKKLDRNSVGQESKDFLQVLLKLKDEADAKMPVTMTEIKALLMDMIVGGTDSTSNAIEFAMAEIMIKPDVLRKLQEELETVVGKDNIVEESHIKQLPYLYAVIKEILRLHPPAPLLAPHCPSETCTVGGYTVPKGSCVFINVWAIHRDPSIWENPTEFRPERFLDNKHDCSGNDFNYFPFGSGRRMCAGIAMAERMFMYSVASLIHYFDWKLPEGETLDVTEKFGIVLKKKMPLVAIPTPRLSNPILYDNSNNGLPPGPRALPLIGNLHSLDPELHTYFASLSQTYGPICRLWLGKKLGIIITSPALAREVLKDQDTIFANRDVPAAGREFSYGGNNIVWNPYGPKWHMLRKVCVREMLNVSTFNSVYALKRRELRQSINYFYNQAGSPVNVGEQMFLTVLNVITSMLWGGTVRGVTKKMKVLAKSFDEIFESIIDQKQKLDRNGVGQESKDFLQVLLKLKDEADVKIPLTMTEIKALLMDMVLGGTDTTANTVEFAMAEIMHKPNVLRKLQQEVDTVVGKDNIVEESHIQQLQYLYAVMKEVLRIHSTAPFLVPHCPSETCTVGGYTVPKGSCVFINVWAIHRDPSIWENPTEFRPERFLDNKWDYSGNDFNYFPFGSGRRMCPGIVMAERMFMYSVASLIHSFDWKLPKGETLDLTEKFGVILKKKMPLVAIPTPRLFNPTLYE